MNVNEEENLKQLTNLWQDLTPTQRKMLVLRAWLFQAEIVLCLLVIHLFLFVARRILVPIPRKVYAHFL